MRTIVRPLAVLLCSATLACLVFAASADPVVHTVRKGETLYGIARNYGISVSALISANGITDPSRLVAGMKLVIPGGTGSDASTPAAASPALSTPQTTTSDSSATVKTAYKEYTVVRGDTLYGIARAHGVRVDEITGVNDMKGTVVKVGQTLRIPVKAPATGSGGSDGMVSGTVTGAGKAGPGASTPGGAGGTAGMPPVPATATVLRDDTLRWPVRGTVSMLQGKLKGVSIEASAASPIEAIRSGTVVSAGPFRGFGLVAFVQSPDGLVYVYGGATTLRVKLGDPVRSGTLVGSTGSVAGPAYFFVFKGADTVDPRTVPRE